MRVNVQYLGPIRVMLKKKEEYVEVSPKTTLIDLLNRLASVYGEGFRSEIFYDDERIASEGLIVTINGTVITQINRVQTVLREGDIVTLLPFLIGGG